jgi:comEA protein
MLVNELAAAIDRGVPLAHAGVAARELSAGCSLTASTHGKLSRVRPSQEEPMIRFRKVAAMIVCGLALAVPAVAAPQEQQTPQPSTTAAVAKAALNLNAATVDQLVTLPGIGPKTAERIIEYRTKSGGFKRVEDLMNVKGIGEKSFLKLKPLVMVKTSEKAPGD